MRLAFPLLVLAFAPAFTVPLPATAQEYPKLKPGQWETTTSSTKNANLPPNTITICTDEAVQKQMMDMGKGMSREMCSKSELRREGGKFVGDSVCKIGESTITSHSVMTIQGDTGYKTVVDSTYDPPFLGMTENTTTITGKNLGPCRDGLQPGDMLMPDGKKFNMKALANRPPAVPPPKSK